MVDIPTTVAMVLGMEGCESTFLLDALAHFHPII